MPAAAVVELNALDIASGPRDAVLIKHVVLKPIIRGTGWLDDNVRAAEL